MDIEIGSIEKYIEEYGIIDGVKAFTEILDKRSYFSVKDFKIIRKEMNLVLPAVAFLGDNKELTMKAFHWSINPVERQIIDKIDRMSTVTVEKLKEKFEKLLYKNSFEFALRYGKELLLRDKKEFYKIVYKFALSDNMDLLKPLMVLSFEKLDQTEDEFIILLISYLTKARSDFSALERENDSYLNCTLDLIRKELGKKELEEKLNSKKGLAILSYLALLEKSEFKNENSVPNRILHNAIEELSNCTVKEEINEIEKALIDSLKK